MKDEFIQNLLLLIFEQHNRDIKIVYNFTTAEYRSRKRATGSSAGHHGCI